LQDLKPYQCEDCDKGFYSALDLKYHTYAHTGERPFKCDQCDHSFIRNGDLGKHVRMKHQNQLRFQCSYCPVKYNRQDQLR
jgi:KRAB domain-containing zinc finger protein